MLLDCESVSSTLKSLARIFRTLPGQMQALLSMREIGDYYESHSQTLPDFKEYILAVVEQHFGSPLPLDSICWFHTTRILPGTTFAEGTLPLAAALPALKLRLVDAVDDARVKGQFRRAVTSGAIEDHHYVDKTADPLYWGPYAILVRDVAFHAAKLSQHDYLGMPEIIEDICNGFKKASGVDLLDEFSAKLKSAIVKFTAMVDYDDACIATALCYVHSMLQEGKMDTNSVMCFDGENNPIPASDIVNVAIIDVAAHQAQSTSVSA